MKKSIYLFILFFGVSLSINAQVEKYYKVSLHATPQEFKKVAELGVTVDHGEFRKGGYIIEISETELSILKNSGVKYDLLISDVAKYYVDRNKNSVNSKTTAGGLCNPSNIVSPANFHLGSMGGFYTYAEMIAEIDNMAALYPTLITTKQAISPINSIEGRPLYYVKISDNPSVDESEPEVLYNSLHHAREAQSLSQLIYYMWYLLENYSTNPEIKGIVDNTEMYFVPCVNPDGYIYNQTINPSGGGMWRKNRRNNGDGTFGVDLNRNYGGHWGYDNLGSSPTTSSDTYRGTSAFSEPETQAMRDFCNSRSFKSALNNHTYSNLLIYPWGYIPSFYTPDSALYVNWANLLTKDNQFLYGTGDQTVNYTTNGDSDDWMYGEQVTKPKIMSMTPEAGSSDDGFWPDITRIEEICKTTLSQNINMAMLVTNYALVKDSSDKFMFQPSAYIKYNVKQLGLQSGSFTVSIVPVGAGIATVGAPKVYSSLSILQSKTDSISYTLSSGLTVGQRIKFLYSVNNGMFSYSDTLTKIYGNPVTLLADNCSNLSQWTNVGFGISTTDFVSAGGSIADSPLGEYGSNQNKSLTSIATLNLTDAVYAHMQFYTKFDIEELYDWAQVQISQDGGTTWFPLCGKHSSLGSSFTTVFGEPLYDGSKQAWTFEEIDLSDYIGQNVKIKFSFMSDPFLEKDGFNVDDVLIRKIGGPGVGLNEITKAETNIYPNPATNEIFINSNVVLTSYSITNQLGQIVQSGSLEKNNVSLKELSNGIYYLTLKNKEQVVSVKRISVLR